jgi:hypothetical protein
MAASEGASSRLQRGPALRARPRGVETGHGRPAASPFCARGLEGAAGRPGSRAVLFCTTLRNRRMEGKTETRLPRKRLAPGATPTSPSGARGCGGGRTATPSQLVPRYVPQGSGRLGVPPCAAWWGQDQRLEGPCPSPTLGAGPQAARDASQRRRKRPKGSGAGGHRAEWGCECRPLALVFKAGGQERVRAERCKEKVESGASQGKL